MGPALWEQAVKEERFPTSQQKTRRERPAAQRAGAPSLRSTPQPETRICWRVEGLEILRLQFPCSDTGGLGWLCGDTLRSQGVVHHMEGVREDAWTHQKSKVPLLGSAEGNVQLPWELFQGRAPLTLYISSRWQLLLPSWTPEVAGTAALCPWEYA